MIKYKIDHLTLFFRTEQNGGNWLKMSAGPRSNVELSRTWKYIHIYVKFVRSKSNGIADSLSRLDFDRFRSLTKNLNINATPDVIAEAVWPAEKVWNMPFNKLICCDF